MKIDWQKDLSMPKLPKLRRPGRPSVGRPSLGRPSLGGPDLQMPKFLTDLYADLRDRRLLPLVALLVVAILAAPILLSGGGGEEEAAAISPAGVEGETKEAGLTVVPAEDGLLHYKRRLGHRHALNPFRRPPGSESSSGTSSASESGSGSEGGSESSSGAEATSSSGEHVVKATIGGVTTETVAPDNPKPVERPHRHKSSQTESNGGETTEAGESTEPTPTEPGPTPTTPTEPAKPVEPTHTEASDGGSSTPAASAAPAVVGYTIDAEAGFVPKTNEKTAIAPMTKLPNKQHPLVLFMGLSRDHKRALFLMTSNVTAYYGGHCALDKDACQLVEVAPGKGVTFAAGYGHTRYKLHLSRIVPVVKRTR